MNLKDKIIMMFMNLFSSYREKRAQSRKLFFDEKRQHKFLKSIREFRFKNL